MNLPKLEDIHVSGKKVLVRADLDVGDKIEPGDDAKLLTNKKTIDFLVEKKAKIILIGHRGRPGGKVDEELSLDKVSERLSELIGKKVNFIYDLLGEEAHDRVGRLESGEILMLENLRFDLREEKNDEQFAEQLSKYSDIYVNEAFSSSAKSEASIVNLPKSFKLKEKNSIAFGFRFLEEIDKIGQIFDNPKKPVISIISGVKEDKLSYVEKFLEFSEKVLIAGRLPDLVDVRGIGQSTVDRSLREKIISFSKDKKVVVADLIQDKEDITIHSIEEFEKIVSTAGTIVLGGPIGKFEDEGHRQGTERVFDAIVNNKEAFKLAGGGDTQQAIDLLGLRNRFDWISVGGGAMLNFLADKTLPGIEAVIS